MSHSESYGYLIIRITGSFLDRCLGTLDCSRALLTRNSRGPSRTVLDFGLKGRIPTFCLVLWFVPLLSIGPSRTLDSVRDIFDLPSSAPPHSLMMINKPSSDDSSLNVEELPLIYQSKLANTPKWLKY